MLTDNVLPIQTANGAGYASLPEALARLCAGTLIGFDGLAAHQRHGWELFLYQIAALALVRSSEAAAVADDAAWRSLDDLDTWRDRLAALTPGCADTAWSLVVGDLTRPAFLQPPIPTGKLDGFTMAGRTPDEIDVLVTAKGHDVKAARAGAAAAHQWLFALVTLQTMQGYSGRGNFGIACMNGGFGSRPLLTTTPSRNLPARFRRGVQAALQARDRRLASDDSSYHGERRLLLWLDPWDGESSLSLAGLDPLFVEVCRRIRLVRDGEGRATAWGRPSEVARVAVPKEAKGDLGDAWTPVGSGAALTVGPSGFDYRLLARLLTSGDSDLPPAMEPPPGRKGDLWLHAAVLVRGQGKTEGLHERWLPIPAAAHRALFGAAQTGAAGQLGKQMVADAGAARAALRLGLLALLQGGADKLDQKDERPREWLDRLDGEVDAVFFPHLFQRLAAERGAEDEARAEAAWRHELGRLARTLFDQAIARLSPPDSRRERGLAVASLLFSGQLRKADLAAPQPASHREQMEQAG